jgi:hypothetical protein
MTTAKRNLLFFLQGIPLLLYPLSLLIDGISVIAFLVLFFIGLGVLLWRGRTWALTLSIFLQGLNAVIRIMMLFSQAVAPSSEGGGINVPFIITSILAITISIWILYRLDQPDIRVTMVS